MKLKEIITDIFTGKAKKKAEEAEAKKRAEEAEAKKRAEEAEAKRKAEEAEAKRKSFMEKPYETLMPLVMKSLETTGNMTSKEISSLLQLKKNEELLTFGFIGGNFVFKTEKYPTNNFYVIKDNHLLTISSEYSPEKSGKRRIAGEGYYGFYRDRYEDYIISSKHSLAFTLDNKKVYEGTVYDCSREDYAALSEHFNFDPNLKSLFDKITFPDNHIKNKMTNSADISRQDEIEQQLSQSLTKYQTKKKEKILEEKKQKEIERLAREKAAQEKEEADRRAEQENRIKAMQDRLEKNPALNVFLNSSGRRA